jgi:hypothetical protein
LLIKSVMFQLQKRSRVAFALLASPSYSRERGGRIAYKVCNVSVAKKSRVAFALLASPSYSRERDNQLRYPLTMTPGFTQVQVPRHQRL